MDRDPERRLEACEGLAGRAIPTTSAILIPMLDDAEPAVRAAAALALGRVRGPGSMWALAAHQDDPELLVRAAIAAALDQLSADGDDDAEQPPAPPSAQRLHDCYGLVSHEDAAVRAAALADLARSREPGVASLLVAGLEDPSHKVRARSVEGLCSHPVGSALKRLLELMEDEEPEVRLACARALGVLGSGAAFTPLVLALADDFQVVREASAAALARLGGDRVVDELRAAARSWVPGSACLLEALESLDLGVMTEVTGWLEHPFEGVRGVALEWVATRRDVRLADSVRLLIEDDEPWIARRAAEILNALERDR